jgi:hypothetical protein
MCRSAYDNLVPGGHFIAYTVNPAYTLSKPNGAQYGSYFCRMTLDATGTPVTGSSSPNRQPPTSVFSGARKRMSRPSKRRGSGRSPGTRQRSHPKTSRVMVKPIGRISTTIASSSGWSARSDLGHSPNGRGHPKGSAHRGHGRSLRQGRNGRRATPKRSVRAMRLGERAMSLPEFCVGLSRVGGIPHPCKGGLGHVWAGYPWRTLRTRIPASGQPGYLQDSWNVWTIRPQSRMSYAHHSG